MNSPTIAKSEIMIMDRGEILSLTEDREGLLWLGTAGSGIKSFDKRSGEFGHIFTMLDHYYSSPADTNSISDYTAITSFC